MKLTILVFVFFNLVSCTSRKAIDLRDTIAQNEQLLTELLISKGSYEEEKLNCLVDSNFKGALIAIDKQERGFDNIIERTKTLSVKGAGNAVKTAAINYYQALKDLHMFDRQEIEQQEIIYGKDLKKVDEALDKLMQLAKKKQHFFQNVYRAEEKFDLALKDFDKTSGL